VSFWLPLPVGLAAAFVYRRRHPRRDHPADAAARPPARHTRRRYQ
jgi:hypothetical protein